MYRILPILTILSLFTATSVPLAFAENVITIIPCSSDRNNPIFFDTTSYYIQKGKQVRWFNADDINHRIEIRTSDGKTLLADSGLIKQNASFSFKFNNVGTYIFSSPTYPWMKGNVTVTDNLASTTLTDKKHNIDVQLTWTPSTPRVGQITNFRIIFLQDKTGKNQPHVDYVFSLNDSTNKTIYEEGLHSSWGIASASYTFPAAGIFIPKVTITASLFQPVEPSEFDFKMSVSA